MATEEELTNLIERLEQYIRKLEDEIVELRAEISTSYWDGYYYGRDEQNDY